MKKIRLGSIEILGYIGIVIWVAVVFLRGINVSNNSMYFFLLGVLPNLAAAWVFTMFGKWIVLFTLEKKYTFKLHLIICIGIFGLALISEFMHDLFLNSPFDIYDILFTGIAQITIISIPLLTRDKYLSSYE